MATDVENVVKIAGLVVGIIAIGFTGCQIRETNKTLVFTTEQNFYKESRDIRKYIADNPGMIVAARENDLSKLNENDKAKLSMQVGLLLNFYNSILQERNKRYVSEDFRRTLIDDFCIIAQWPQVAIRLPDTPNKPFHRLAELKRSECHA